MNVGFVAATHLTPLTPGFQELHASLRASRPAISSTCAVSSMRRNADQSHAAPCTTPSHHPHLPETSHAGASTMGKATPVRLYISPQAANLSARMAWQQAKSLTPALEAALLLVLGALSLETESLGRGHGSVPATSLRKTAACSTADRIWWGVAPSSSVAAKWPCTSREPVYGGR